MPDSTYLFIGDSVTDAGRFEDHDEHLGDGYVRRLDEHFRDSGLTIETINTGIGGNRVADLKLRWERDVVNHRPALLSVLVGVNDTWRRYDNNDPTTWKVLRPTTARSSRRQTGMSRALSF